MVGLLRWLSPRMERVLGLTLSVCLPLFTGGCEPAALTVDATDVRYQKESIASFCGDGYLEGEDCETDPYDGTTLFRDGLDSCEALGYEGGTLGCTSSCDFDVSECVGSVCGNGFVDEGEVCDGGPTRCPYGESCTLCVDCEEVEGTRRFCGDGVTDYDGDEACDQSAPISCLELADYDGGQATCADDCTWSIDTCEGQICGDGVVQDGEVCDCNFSFFRFSRFEPCGELALAPCVAQLEHLGLDDRFDASDFDQGAACECGVWNVEACTIGGRTFAQLVAGGEPGTGVDDVGVDARDDDDAMSSADASTTPLPASDDGCAATGRTGPAAGWLLFGALAVGLQRRRRARP